MNHYGGKQLAASFRTVRKNTLQIAEEIPEDKYGFRAAQDVRSVGELLAHIALANAFQEEVNRKQKLTTMEGFDFPALFQQMRTAEQTPRTKAQTIELLRTGGDRWASWLEGLSDDLLAEVVTMPAGGSPPSRTRFDMLLSVKEHEMHHRGQLMLIERIIGIVPHLTRERQARMAGTAATSKA